MEKLRDYYSMTIRSAGVSEVDTENYVDRIMKDLTGLGVSGDVTSLLNMKLEDFNFDRKEEASLVNPALLKSQIVNFMKYRGPIEFGLGFLDSIKSFSTIGNQLEVVSAKQTYYKERQTVVEACETVWINIRAYNELELNEAKFQEWHTYLNEIKAEYKFINRNLVWDYYGAKKNFTADAHTYAVDHGEYFDFYWKGVKVKTNKKNVSEMTTYVQDMDNAITTFKEELNSEKSKQMCLGETEGVYDIKQVIYYQQHVNDGKGYPKAAYELYKAYNNFVTAKKQLEEYIVNKEQELASAKSSLSSAESSLESAQSQLSSLESQLSSETNEDRKEDIRSSIQSVESDISYYSSEISYYNSKIPKLEEDIVEKKGWQATTYNGKSLNTLQSEYSSYYFDDSTMRNFSKITHGMSLVISGSSTISYKNTDRTYANVDLVAGKHSNEILTQISKDMKDKYKTLEDANTFLVNAQGKLIEISKALSEGGSLTNAEGEWEKKASVSEIQGTTISEQNLSEIESVREFINKDEVDQLLAHVQGALDTINTAKSEIEAYRYGNTMIKDLEKMDKAVKEVEKVGFKDSLKDVPAHEVDLDRLEEDVFRNTYKEPDVIFTHSWSDIKYHPELEKANLNFYGYLKQLFNDITKEGDLKEKKEAGEKVQNETETKLAQYEKVKDNDIDGEITGDTKAQKFVFTGKNLPSYQWIQGGLKNELIQHNEEAEA
ncbi:MAG: hypothetical protein GX237_07230, partial [Clostridiales bacterium]|nr:hypothetical protein [Clostridiales bacterium]